MSRGAAGKILLAACLAGLGGGRLFPIRLRQIPFPWTFLKQSRGQFSGSVLGTTPWRCLPHTFFLYAGVGPPWGCPRQRSSPWAGGALFGLWDRRGSGPRSPAPWEPVLAFVLSRYVFGVVRSGGGFGYRLARIDQGVEK